MAASSLRSTLMCSKEHAGQHSAWQWMEACSSDQQLLACANAAGSVSTMAFRLDPEDGCWRCSV
eukprot:4437-Heterococcus_DN1.PRE.2